MRITSRKSIGVATLGALLGLLVFAAAPARGDWLILASGERIETKGPWKVKGKQIVYTASDKTLRSLRLSDVDVTASTRASSLEPASQPRHYQDLGEAPDIGSVRPPANEFNRLNAWISNPNAPRVSGTVSAPGLHVSEEDLAREGMKLLENPKAVENDMMRVAAEIDDQYQRCVEVHSKIGDSGQCGEDYSRSANDLRQRASQASAALSAARSARLREARMQQEDVNESDRIERMRQQEEREAQEASGKEAEAQNRPPG
ncbi:MAG: hypothetical protein ABI689_01935 [Thermoanaerobaculia bacterium]